MLLKAVIHAWFSAIGCVVKTRFFCIFIFEDLPRVKVVESAGVFVPRAVGDIVGCSNFLVGL
jgi:hypothetical protein